ncbi:IutA [Klebsiella pneumoniae]|uniref:IutA n=1 Tax=Klebsiella pneumoniae TaxID=573 RepID=A0A2X3CBY0_KLEPN|nr:IutA [Klebsiella pneumoniae]
MRFYPFPTVNANKQVTAFSSSQQDTDQYGMKLTLNSKTDGRLANHLGLDADHERFTSNQMFFDLAQASASGGLNNKKIYTTGRYPSYDITNLAAFPAIRL